MVYPHFTVRDMYSLKDYAPLSLKKLNYDVGMPRKCYMYIDILSLVNKSRNINVYDKLRR